MDRSEVVSSDSGGWEAGSESDAAFWADTSLLAAAGVLSSIFDCIGAMISGCDVDPVKISNKVRSS